ncbi:glyceraldehyde-3-phosphate dehydrogenase [Curtobacterium pusillum]|uniref:Glyceraldehyde-3-phosphate dehydrogenase n=1 Tax=Curtobacterium pusillum TaxID=69373 RepID=A0ABX2MEP3_9MICO|nr:glyceraldehyde-3-phosphate dehydrogenase [Curtobacterium pusillum]NUU14242.1 glyceraldehyde-3-phosphate dehydrogenase [Curtobacterium pusillum]GLK30649.1 glyceraldehyde-3-phosphate dehydrogenase [Curtobacterium pusillum]
MTADAGLWDDWSARLEVAEAMIPIIGRLHRRDGVVTAVYGRRLVNRSAIDIVKAHRFARHVDGAPLPLDESLRLLRAVEAAGAGPASLDLGALAARARTAPGASIADLLPELQGDGSLPVTDVVLYGFGRIGRLLARILISHQSRSTGLRLRAIVVREATGTDDLVKRASLLRRDSVHGPFDGTISVDEETQSIVANGTRIAVIRAADPAAIDYTAYGIDDAILVDNTGRWRTEDELRKHLEAKGVARVLLTAPGKGAIPNVVHGLNTVEAEHAPIVAAASCTTNAVAPVLAALDAEYGIVRGHVETVHSFTNDQNLTDNFHKADRRGRAAPLNMVITETGAARAVAKAVPTLAGKLTGSAIRVPTADVSLAILNLRLKTSVGRERLNTFLRTVSLGSSLRSQVDYVESPEYVSSDVLGSRFAGVVDGLATQADGEDVVVYVWYDNEFGYSYQVVRVLETMSGAHPASMPAPRPANREELAISL